jgi:chorismate mutase/prephenate dehydratase
VNLSELRKRIDQIDAEILRLLAERCNLTHQIGRHKKNSGTKCVWVPERENQVLEHLLSLPRGHLTERGLRAIFRQILSAGRETQGGLIVAVNGANPQSTLLHARCFFGDCTDYICCNDTDQALEKLREKKAHLVVCEQLPNAADTQTVHSLITDEGKKLFIISLAE